MTVYRFQHLNNENAKLFMHVYIYSYELFSLFYLLGLASHEIYCKINHIFLCF